MCEVKHTYTIYINSGYKSHLNYYDRISVVLSPTITMFKSSNLNHDGDQSFSVKKQPLKRFEIPINKFKDVAIPHHVDLLRRHKDNIEKFQIQGDWTRVHREQINATRLVKQLKSLLYDMDILRSQVEDVDIAKFDKLLASACQNAHNAIEEYLALNPERQIMPSWNTDSNDKDETPHCEESSALRLQDQISVAGTDLEQREECLKSWESLRAEAEDIHQLFVEFSQIVHEQQESVDCVETSVDTTAENVAQGESHLRHIKTAMYPVAGAIIGGCVGGPVGLMAGMKLGGLAALGCGIIGFTGGKFLKKKKEEEDLKFGVEMDNLRAGPSVTGSVSMPHIATTSEFKPSLRGKGSLKEA